MKELLFLAKIVFILFLSGLFACVEYPDYDSEPADNEIILKSANGFTSETGQEFFVQQNVATILYLQSQNKTINEVSWNIEGESYKGNSVSHVFKGLGVQTVEVKITFSDNSTTVKTFKLTCLIDISKEDPIKPYFVKDNGSTVFILFLVSKERLIQESSDYYFIGTMTEWEKKKIQNANNYIIDDDNNYQKVSDVGTHLGFIFEIKDMSENHELAIVLSNGNWVDLSGSALVDKENYTKAKFYYEASTKKIIAYNNYSDESMPGSLGDLYFRFQLNDESIDIFFNFEKVYQNAYCRIRAENGEYEPYIEMDYLSSYQNWAKVTLNRDLVSDRILDIRFGENYNNPNTNIPVMEKSDFYSSYFKSIRISLVDIE